jgi:hypothetical protein
MMTLMATTLVSLNFFAVITGAADRYYDLLTDLLMPLLMNRY